MKKTIALIIIIAIALSLTMFSGCNIQPYEYKYNKSVYEIEISLDVDSKMLDCKQKITYYNNTDTTMDKLMLNLHPNALREDAAFKPYKETEISSVFPNGISYGHIEILSVKVDTELVEHSIGGEDMNVLIVPISEFFPDDNIEIMIDFKVKLPNSTLRMGYNSYSYNIANFYPIIAPYDKDGFYTDIYTAYGDPFYSDVSDYKVSLTLPQDMVVANTGIVESVNNLENNLKRLDIAAENVRDFAIVCSPHYHMISQTVGDTIVKYFHKNDANANQSLAIAASAIETFSELFGAYPYKEYSVCQVDFSEGGMEYPMLTYIAKSNDIDFYNKVIIHETAHQWWYAVVGNNQIEYAWLDEGLTEFSTALYYKHNDNIEEMTDMLHSAYDNYVLFIKLNNRLKVQLDTSMNRTLKSYNSQTEYYYNSYVKGMLLFSSLYEIFGEEKFLLALKCYYMENQFNNANPDNLIKAFNEAASYNTESLFASWLDGKVIIAGLSG